MKSKSEHIAETQTVDHLTHLTLNTRHVTVTPVQSLHPVLAAHLMPILVTGGGPIPMLPGFHVKLRRGRNSLQLSIAKYGIEIVAGALLWGMEDENLAWEWLSSILIVHASIIPAWGAEPAPCKPSTLPWLGVVLLATFCYLTYDEARAVGSFESILALAALSNDRSRN